MQLVLLAATPSPLWYATRAAGTLSLVLLTAVLILGLAITARLEMGSRWRFVVHGLHRNLSLLTVVFLVIHILAAVLDPYAGLSWRDALIPFTSSYRPFYLGLGVVAVELLAALVLTGLLQRWIGVRAFRLVHWAAYACWPIALVHGLGTGSDVRSGWFYLLSVACVSGALAAFLSWRLLRGRPERSGVRVAAAIATLLGVAVLGAWTFTGPLQGGWALAAGTPSRLIRSNAPAASTRPSVPPLGSNLDDVLQGTVTAAGPGFLVSLADTTDPTLTIQIAIAASGSARGTVTIARSGTRLCSVAADLVNPIAGSCAGTPFQIQLRIAGNRPARGRLTTGAGAGGSPL